MTDTGEPTGEAPATTGMSPDRRGQLEEEIDQLRLRAGKAESEQRLLTLGLVGMVGGVVLAFVGWIASTGASDSRDVISMVALAILGLTLAVAGSALFIRYSIARFLRLWLLRLIYEQRDQADRITGSR